MVNKNVLLDRSIEFAVKIVRLVQTIHDDKKDELLAREIFKSGTKIGARLREAEHSENLEHFINCLQRASTKAIQVDFHLELAFKVNVINQEANDSLKREASLLRKMIEANIKAAKQKLK